MKSILIIDDDIEFCHMLRAYLVDHDIQLDMQHDGSSGLAALRSHRYDMVLLDVVLPGIDGLQVLSHIKSFSSLSILLMSIAGSDAARIAGLDEGADDYLPKPFNPRELVARIQAVFRRSERASVHSYVAEIAGIPGLTLNQSAREAYYRGNRLVLTEVEFALLSIFLDSPDMVLTREDLIARVFQRPFNPLDRSLDVHICRLRKKLEIIHGLSNPIKSIRGSGYLFSPEATA
jgi:two-component system response regulator CpxR